MSLQLKWPVIIFLYMGLLATVSYLLMLYALKLANLSSLQPLKILEPMIAGVFFDYKHIPIEIMAGLLLFVCGSWCLYFKR